MLVMAYGMKKGEIFLWPFSTKFLTPSWKTVRPPMPVPTSTPALVRSSLPYASALSCLSRPACFRAFLEATTEYVRQSSYRLAFFLSTILQCKAGLGMQHRQLRRCCVIGIDCAKMQRDKSRGSMCNFVKHVCQHVAVILAVLLKLLPINLEVFYLCCKSGWEL